MTPNEGFLKISKISRAEKPSDGFHPAMVSPASKGHRRTPGETKCVKINLMYSHIF